MSASPPEDFIVKPLKVDELLDWIGRKLGLNGSPPTRRRRRPPPADTAAAGAPPEAHLAALDELINLGYLRGILNKLAEIERLDPAHGEFVRVLRDLARQFQFDAMKEFSGKMRDARTPLRDRCAFRTSS